MTSVEAGVFPPSRHVEFIMSDIAFANQEVAGTIEPEVVPAAKESGLTANPLEIPLERTVIEFDTARRHRKDPSFTVLPDGRNLLLISENDTDTQGGWRQAAYIADDLKAPVWKKLGDVSFNGIDPTFIDEHGEVVERTLCAAGAFPNGEGLVVQDLCFHDGGNVHVFKGSDPTNLEYAGVALRSDPSKGIAGVYDPEPVDGLGPKGGVINLETGEEEFFISVTTVGSYRVELENGNGRRLYFPQDGAIALAKRSGGWIGEYEYAGGPILTEYQVPGHRPTKEDGEWVPEGGKITELPEDAEEFNLVHQSRNEDGTFRIELATIKMEDLGKLMDKKGAGKRFLHYFTAFVDGPEGSRQRGYLASSDTLYETPKVLGIIEPMRTDGEFKETGHGTVQIKRRSVPSSLPQAA